MYTLLCCADLYGQKVNLEVTLDDMPRSIAELEQYLAVVFSAEAACLRPRNAPDITSRITIALVQIYDDATLQWRDLRSLAQLHEYDQLYLFQPQTEWHTDTQQDLPPPCPPSRSRASSAVAHRFGHSTFSSSPQHDQQHQRVQHSQSPSQRMQTSPRVGQAPHVATVSAAASKSGPMRSASRSSPTAARLAEQEREELTLVGRLEQLREEKERLAHAAAMEAEEEKRRQAEAADKLLRAKEEEIWRQRERLRQTEREFQQLLREKQTLVAPPQRSSYS